MFRQGDPAWADKRLDGTSMTMEHFGCTVTDVAQALTLSGHPVNPGELVDKLNSINGITPDGLLVWAKVSEAFPAFHFGGQGYEFVKGFYKKYQHWILRHNGKSYDPLFGAEQVPAGFVEAGVVRTASIDQVNTPVPPHPAPAPAPVPTPPPTIPKPQNTYTVVKGDNLTNICKKHYGIQDDGAAYKKALEVAKFNGIPNPDLIYPGQVIRLP